MLNPPTDLEPNNWHRYFAMSGNNRAWNLVEASRSAATDLELLNVAHASAWHWEATGTELQKMRARMLVAAAHGRLGLGATAWTLAEEMRAFFLGQAETPDWEIAFTHAIHALAAHAAGRSDAHRASYRAAEAAIAAIADDEDRGIVQGAFAIVPKPQ
jgi:hypothetical protein